MRGFDGLDLFSHHAAGFQSEVAAITRPEHKFLPTGVDIPPGRTFNPANSPQAGILKKKISRIGPFSPDRQKI